MRKARISLVLIALTVAVTVMLQPRKEEPAKARVIAVSRGDVHVTAAISGRLAYMDEKMLYAPQSGMVSRICVKEGQRLGAGEAIVRFDEDNTVNAISAAIENPYFDELNEMIQHKSTHTVVRAENACTVRDIYVEEDMMIVAGTPLARLSSNRQTVKCSVFPEEARKIEKGMWAWIYSEGDELGIAEVIEIGTEKTDTITGTIVKEVILKPEKTIQLPEGATVDAHVYLSGSDDVMALPVEAITERETVWWVNEGRCTEIPAQIVMNDEMLAWVKLPEGLLVAVGEFSEGQPIWEEKK